MLPITINRRQPATVMDQLSSDGDHGTATHGELALNFLSESRFILFSPWKGHVLNLNISVIANSPDFSDELTQAVALNRTHLDANVLIR